MAKDTVEKAGEPKKDTSFRLLKQGRQINFVGSVYGRGKDLNPLCSKDQKEFIKNITKKSFVPFQKILDSFPGKKLPDNYLEKTFETEVFEKIPDNILNPVLPKGLGKKQVAK